MSLESDAKDARSGWNGNVRNGMVSALATIADDVDSAITTFQGGASWCETQSLYLSTTYGTEPPVVVDDVVSIINFPDAPTVLETEGDAVSANLAAIVGPMFAAVGDSVTAEFLEAVAAREPTLTDLPNPVS